MLRAANAKRPSSPVPSRIRLDGSGVGVEHASPVHDVHVPEELVEPLPIPVWKELSRGSETVEICPIDGLPVVVVTGLKLNKSMIAPHDVMFPAASVPIAI